MTLTDPLGFPNAELIHGTLVQDPYRWLEDSELPATRRWIQDQQTKCASYFGQHALLGRIRSRVESLLDVQAVDQPCKVESRYFFRRRGKGQEQASIYLSEEARDCEHLLVDPSSEGSFASVEIYRVSDDGSLLAYGLARGGGDRREIRIVDVKTKTHKPGVLPNGYRRGLAFATNHQGFYYVHEVEPTEGEHAIRFRSFSDRGPDGVVFSRPRSPGSTLTLIADDVHLGAIFIEQKETRRSCEFFVARRTDDTAWDQVFRDKSVPHAPILHRGRIFVVSYEARVDGEVVELLNDGREQRTIVHEGESQLRQIAFVGHTIYVSYLSATCSLLESWTLEGERIAGMEMPRDVTIKLLPQLTNSASTLFFTKETFTQPPTIFECPSETCEASIWNKSVYSPAAIDVSVSSTSYRSRDGQSIPVSIVGKTRRSVSKLTPFIMTSYGGFGIPSIPEFSVFVTVMLELGATLAIPHIRGGGEYGTAWHDAAKGTRRQKSIEDFIAAADWLCREEFTSPEKLAVFGGSHSGLLVGAAITQAPELFRAGLCIAPLLDMVRYELFNRAARWRVEYGSISNLKEFQALYAYSPFHRVQDDVNYPSMLFVTGDQDDRCNPAHVRKMAARLQDRTCQLNPIIVDYSTQRGHSPVLPLTVRIDALTRRIAFLCFELDIEILTEVDHDAVDR